MESLNLFCSKATAGGGGRGMRLAKEQDEFVKLLQQAKSEVAAAFNNDGVYLEKYIQNPRHIEIQWFEIYKEYAANPFFIAGESFAGIYVPMLALEVVKGLDAGSKPVINLKEMELQMKHLTEMLWCLLLMGWS